MSGKVAVLKDLLEPKQLASGIAQLYTDWNNQRAQWLAEQREKRNYIFATDTTKTSNAALPWKNKTTLPKLTQIRDSLHANYLSALFPNEEWMKWEAHSLESSQLIKRSAIQNYMSNKIRQSGFERTISQLLFDYIDYGNAFCTTKWVSDVEVDEETGEAKINYIGPKLERISPTDIVFNPTSPSFEDSPKIRRTVTSLAELEQIAATEPENTSWAKQAIRDISEIRKNLEGFQSEDFEKAVGYSIDGFGSLQEYYASGLVELLTLTGDVYDPDSQTYLRNRTIIVADRTHVVLSQQNPAWIGKGYELHSGWRTRPDNLYAMGPLDNLVGMQYRIDHLENIKADVFDLIAHPPLKIFGEVEEFSWGPFEKILIDEGGDVQMLVPDVTALNANTEIAILQQQMEEFAGSPRETMGFRTPGEKTAFEVSTLITAAGRLFQEKITKFESEIIEAALNNMLELARRNLDGGDVVRVIDPDLGVESFVAITREDISGRGILRARGARHFISQAQIVQNLVQMSSTPLWQEIKPHISQKSLTSLVEDILGLDRFDLFKDNANIIEQAETARIFQQEQENIAVEGQISAEVPQEQGGEELDVV